jgi:hypothetical protein
MMIPREYEKLGGTLLDIDRRLKLLETQGRTSQRASTSRAPGALRQITPEMIPDKAIGSRQLQYTAIGTNHLRALAVNQEKLAESAVITSKLADLAVDTDKLANLATTAAKLAANSVEDTKLAGSENLVMNPGFEMGDTSYWALYVNSGAGASASFAVGTSSPYQGSFKGAITITNPGSSDIDIQIYSTNYGISLVNGVNYILRIAAKAASARTVKVSVQKNVSPFTSYGLFKQSFSLTADWQVFELPFTANATVSDARVLFYLGGDSNDVDMDAVDLFRADTTSDPMRITLAHIENAAIGAAAIGYAAIGSAHIGTAVIQNAHINDISADKINAGTIRAINVFAAAHVTVGTYTTGALSGGESTVNVEDTSDFPSSGNGWFVDSTNDNDAFFWTGKTGTTLTGCSGVLAHNAGAIVVPEKESIVISSDVNKLRVFGERNYSSSKYKELVNIGAQDLWGHGIDIIAHFGASDCGNVAILAEGAWGTKVSICDSGYGLIATASASPPTSRGPLCLVPSTSASAPSHIANKGTFWVTSAGILYINTSGSTTWQKVGAQ